MLIEAVLEKVQLKDWVARLPKGLETEIGERGIKLSGGERQRLAFARVFFQASKIVILDEPTSALDGITEGQVMQNLLELVRGRTVIVVAHRLKTVRSVDKILVLQDGMIVEEGSWAELVTKNGLFTKLLAKQALETPGYAPRHDLDRESASV